VSCIECYSSCNVKNVGNLDAIECGVVGVLKCPNPLGLKCDTITSPTRLVNTFIHQMITDLLKRDKPIKVAINFKSWSTTRDISSEWG
jgi:CxxC motif-containing protein